MSRTRLRAGPRIHAAGVTLVPLEETHVTVLPGHGRWLVGADKRAKGVVVIDGRGVRAFSEEGEPLDLEVLRGRVEGLRESLA